MTDIYPVTIPKWGIEMQEGTVTEWRVAVGEPVDKGDELIDIESDKIVNTMEAPVSGVLRRIVAEVDETLKVGQLLGVIASPDTDEDAIDAFIAGFVPADAGFGIDEDDTGESEPRQAAPETRAPASTPGGEVRVSPVARRLAEKLGVDLAAVTGTGRNGRISTDDVEAAARGKAGEPGDPAAPAAVPLSSRALAAARRLVESKQTIPHFYLQRDLDLRNALAAKDREGVAFTALLLKAMSDALQNCSTVNAHFVDDALQPQQGVAINVAVDTEAGLVAPVLRDLQNASPKDIATRLRDLAERARGQALSREDLAPGGATLSNLGMFGITQFSAIINPPQVAILAVGRLRPLELEVGAGAVPALTATLSCDHRAIDGASGARFLAALQEALDAL